MENKEVSSNTKKKKKKIKETKPKITESIKKNYGPDILRLYIKDPGRTNVSIAQELGCNESTVRLYLSRNGKYKQLVDNAIIDFYRKEIFVLQTKAFKRMNELLDDPSTPQAVQATVCKYLLDRFNFDRAEQTGEITEWETHISDNGVLTQTKRTVHVSKKISEDSEDPINRDIRGEDDSKIINI